MGRLTKYKPEMLDIIIDNMSEGASKTEISALIDVSAETMLQWCNPEGAYYNPTFSETIKRGVALSKAWWENQGRSNLENKEFSPVLWYMNMKNRFGWADKQEVTGKDGKDLIPASIKIELVTPEKD